MLVRQSEAGRGSTGCQSGQRATAHMGPLCSDGNMKQHEAQSSSSVVPQGTCQQAPRARQST